MTTKTNITLPPLPEARIVSYQTDSTMRSMELRTYSDEDMRDYAEAAVEANSLSADDLADIDDALANLIQDKRDYCPHEDGTAEHVARLEALRQRLTHGGNCAAVEADRQGRVPSDAWALIEKYADAVTQYNEALHIDVGVDKAGADCLTIEKQLRALLSRYSSQPAASAKPSGYAYNYPGWGIRFNDGREINGCKPTEALPYWFGAAPVAQEPVAEIYRAHYGNRMGNIGVNAVRALVAPDDMPPPGTKLYAAHVAAQAQAQAQQDCAPMGFKNFHRLLCERFGYCHDERDWKRDQISLIEHIAKQVSAQDREDAHDIEAAAKTLAECMDYPWEPMPEKGREAMRKYAKRVIDAARAARGADHG